MVHVYMHYSITYPPGVLESTYTMLISVSISAGLHTILFWAIMVVEELWSPLDLYPGI